MEFLIEAVGIDRQFEQLIENSGMRLVNCGSGGGPCCSGHDMGPDVRPEPLPEKG